MYSNGGPENLWNKLVFCTFSHSKPKQKSKTMKSLLQRAAAAAVMLWSAVAGVQAQNMVCHIEGTTTDAQTDTVMLAEVTEDFRSSVAVERVAVKDGHFACTLTADAPRCYQGWPRTTFSMEAGISAISLWRMRMCNSRCTTRTAKSGHR